MFTEKVEQVNNGRIYTESVTLRVELQLRLGYPARGEEQEFVRWYHMQGFASAIILKYMALAVTKQAVCGKRVVPTIFRNRSYRSDAIILLPHATPGVELYSNTFLRVCLNSSISCFHISLISKGCLPFIRLFLIASVP
jgi:hypothetical protein